MISWFQFKECFSSLLHNWRCNATGFNQLHWSFQTVINATEPSDYNKSPSSTTTSIHRPRMSTLQTLEAKVSNLRTLNISKLDSIAIVTRKTLFNNSLLLNSYICFFLLINLIRFKIFMIDGKYWRIFDYFNGCTKTKRNFTWKRLIKIITKIGYNSQ